LKGQTDQNYGFYEIGFSKSLLGTAMLKYSVLPRLRLEKTVPNPNKKVLGKAVMSHVIGFAEQC
jgi:hypothetical protein